MCVTEKQKEGTSSLADLVLCTVIYVYMYVCLCVCDCSSGVV